MRNQRGATGFGGIRNLLFFLLLVVLVPILLVQAAVYYREYQLARRDEFQSNLEIARAAAGLFESYIRDVHREEVVAGAALTQLTPYTTAVANDFLRQVDDQYPAIAFLVWVDPLGRVLASSVPGLLNSDQSKESWFRPAVSKRDVVVTDLVRSAVPGDATFTTASGIYDAAGTFRGVIAAAIDPDFLSDWLRIDRARGGAFSITDSSGWLVYRYPHAEMTPEQRNWGKLYAPIRDALAGKESRGDVLATYENRRRFLSTTPIASIGWVAGAGRPSDLAISPIRQQITRDGVIVTAGGILAFLVAITIAGGITKRVRRLSEYAVALGQGKFRRRVEEQGPGEMLDLARSLNRMAGELQLRELERERLLQVERERAQNAQLLEAIQENAQTYLAYLDLDLRYVRVNGAYLERTGFTREELIGHPYEKVAGSPEVMAALGRARATGGAVRLPEVARESRVEPGVLHYWDWAAGPVKDEQGKVYGIVVSATDVTEQVRAREERLAAERARAEVAETVAAEINHRMKNNLVLLSSVLQLQLATQPPGSDAAIQLRDAITRVSSLSVVHEHLYQGHPGRVELSDVLRRIGEITANTLSAGDVRLSITGETVYASSKVGATFAMVANELLTNALKYGAAGADGRKRISVDLSRREEALHLRVWNSGNSVPPGFDASKQQGIGLRLVHGVISGQLNGTFVLCPHEGGTLAEVIIDQRALDNTGAGAPARGERGGASARM